jgi:hypothetical protein
MDIQELKKLSNIDLTGFEGNEQNVKYNIVLRLLNCFGYDRLDLEHAAQGSRIDINIGNKIIVETKALDKDLNKYVSQVQDYCNIERPYLAILTNGKSFRFYSPFMRVPQFSDTLIYDFQISDFSNEEVCNRVNKIIGIENFKNGTYLTFIEERESELKQIRDFIDDFEKRNNNDINEIIQEIEQLKSEVAKIESDIQLKKQEIEQIKNRKIPERDELFKKHFIPKKTTLNQVIQTQTTTTGSTGIIRQPQVVDNSKVFTIDSPREGVKAKGKYYDTRKFTVLAGSTVSISLDPSFGNGVADGAFELRKDLEKTGIIADRQFTEDYTFNSISQAACVLLGGSRSGPREWK